MNTPVWLSQNQTPFRVRANQAARTAFWSVGLWLAYLPAARAHAGDETPSPDKVAWGVVCFVGVTAWLLVACLRAPRKRRGAKRRPARPKPFPTLPHRLTRLLFWQTPSRQMPFSKRKTGNKT